MAARTKLDVDPAKAKYRDKVTNWAENDRERVNRGRMTSWFDDASVQETWTPP